MDKDKTAVDTTLTAAPEKVEVPTTPVEDIEARLEALEAEKNAALEREANYKMAFLKEKSKKRGENLDSDEDEDERIARIVEQKLSATKIAAIDMEKEMLLKRLAKENKELKLAQLNKTTTPPAAVGTHSESRAVQDTTITAEQLTAFKAKGWSDKDIERYKKNLQRYAR